MYLSPSRKWHSSDPQGLRRQGFDVSHFARSRKMVVRIVRTFVRFCPAGTMARGGKTSRSVRYWRARAFAAAARPIRTRAGDWWPLGLQQNFAGTSEKRFRSHSNTTKQRSPSVHVSAPTPSHTRLPSCTHPCTPVRQPNEPHYHPVLSSVAHRPPLYLHPRQKKRKSRTLPSPAKADGAWAGAVGSSS